MTVIKGYSGRVLRWLAHPKLRHPVEQIDEAGDRAAALTKQLLAFSRRQVLQPKTFDLNGLLTNMGTILRRLIGEDIEMITVPAADLGSVRADPGQMEQVIMNLVLNARDAMPQGGKITLETAHADFTQTYSQGHPGAVPGKYVMLAVSDTGIGMDAETQARIFKPFFTTKELGKGMALGLAMTTASSSKAEVISMFTASRVGERRSRSISLVWIRRRLRSA